LVLALPLAIVGSLFLANRSWLSRVPCAFPVLSSRIQVEFGVPHLGRTEYS